MADKRTTAEVLAEYEDKLKIDKHDLDNVLIAQPQLFYEVSDEFAFAVSRRDRAKLVMEKARAELDVQMRKTLSESEKRPTDTAVASKVLLTPKMQDLQDDYHNLRRIADRWEALKDSYQQRSYVLKDLVALFIAGYFSNASAGAARSVATDKQAERNLEAAAVKRSARKKK